MPTTENCRECGKPITVWEDEPLLCDECRDKDEHTCTSCGEVKEDTERQYSFGIYAGKMCGKCAYEKYRDHCGLVKKPDGTYTDEGEQGDVTELAEFETGGYDAIYGEQ